MSDQATESTTETAWSPASGGGGGSGSLPPPPPSGGGGYDGGDPYAPDAAAARASALHHWAEDDHAPHAGRMLDEVAADAGNLDDHDRFARMSHLYQLGEAKKQQADAQADAAEAKIHDRADQHKAQIQSDEVETRGRMNAPPNQVHGEPTGGSPLMCTADRGQMMSEVESRSQAELSQLEAKFAEQKAQLEEKLSGQLGSLADEQKTQNEGLLGHQAKGDAKSSGEIAKRVGAHREQIDKESTALHEQATQQGMPLAEQAEQDAAQAEADAARQADATRKGAAVAAQAAKIAAIGPAALARANGNIRAAEATAAANARIEELKAASDGKAVESVTVIMEGVKRSVEARAEGEKAAKEIEAKGEADSKAILDKAERDAASQLARGKEAADRARNVGRQAQGRVQKTADNATAEMDSRSRESQARMESERSSANLQSGAQIAGANGTMNEARTDAAKKADKEKTDTLGRMQTSYDDAKKKILDKRDKNLDRIAKAKDADLCKVQKVVDGDLKVMERTAEDTEKQLKLKVSMAEQRLAVEVGKQKWKMRGAAAKAKLAIDKFVRDAQIRIGAADKGTKEQIAEAAKRGKEAVNTEAGNALHDETVANQLDRNHVNSQAAAEQTATGEMVTQSLKDNFARAAEVNDTIDQQWLAEAIGQAQTDLDDTGITNVVTDGEANHALNVIASLPPRLQGKAVDSLPEDQFENLLDEVPEERRKDFDEMVKYSKDPERKLKLWKEQHASQTDYDVERLKGDTGSVWSWDTPEQDENDRRDSRRRDAASETKDEIEDEYDYLMEKAENGNLTLDQVDDLVERKGIEHDLEMKYNTNLTNERGERKDGSKIVWTTKELKQLEGTFGQVPEGHMAGNAHMEEIRREDMATDGYLWWETDSPTTGGMHSGGKVTVFDTGAKDKDGFRHGGDARELASPHICGICGAKITRLDMVLTHEIGHDVHDQNDELFKKFQKAAGWEVLDDGDLEDRGLTSEEIKKLEATRDDNYSGRNQIRKDGKIYMVDPYSGDFLVVDDTALPESGESDLGAGADKDSDTWAYARSNFKDHFAEMYAKAVHVPEKLHHDLIDRPKKSYEDAVANIEAQDKAIKAMEASGADTTAAKEQLAKSKADASHLEKAMNQQKEMYGIMRKDVFHADDAATDARKRLEESGASPDKLKEFDKQVEMAATPAQVTTIEEGLK